MALDFVDELKWRGMVHDMTPGTQERLKQGPITGYAGFDPTARSLQIGNLVPIMMLMHLQRAGHKPIALVGGATGMVGDPSGKSEERNLLSPEEIRNNVDCFRAQLSHFLDFGGGPTGAEMVNNYDWFENVKFLDFLRDVGKHLTIGYMLAKDSVQSRMDAGISFTEFSYQLLQGYDFLHLYQHRHCELQLGGSDQWGNITAGCELIRRKLGAEAHALVCPLVTRSDGTKFGKSAAGERLWLDASMTSAYKFYQFWLNVPDADAATFIRVFTLLPQEQIKALEQEQAKAPHLRPLQKALAKDITVRVHSDADYQAALAASELLFGDGTTEMLKALSEKDLLAVMDGVPRAGVPRAELEAGVNVVDLLARAGVFASKGEAKRMLAGGGVSINKSRVASGEISVTASMLLNNRYLLVQKGKKSYYLVVAE